MKKYVTPIKIHTNDTTDVEIRRFGRTVEEVLGTPPAFQDRVFKVDNGDAVILAIDLTEDHLRTMEKQASSHNYEIVERPWENLLVELAEEKCESFDINAALS